MGQPTTTPSSPAQLVQACLEAVLAVPLPIAAEATSDGEPCIVVTKGSWYGDAWSGVTVEEHVTVEQLRHPSTGAALGVRLTYTTHDLSGQVDDWRVTLSGFSEEQAVAIRDGLHPHHVDLRFNNHLRYRWTIDGRKGAES